MKQAYAPSMADAAVKAKTGKDWAEWFTVLDRAGAAKMAHKQIAQLLHEKHAVPGWWSQMVTVEYERARGLREVHQTAGGFSVSVTKTVAAELPALYAALADAKQRRRWLPQGKLEVTSQTENKSLRGRWNGTARVDFGFYAKGAGKSQIAVQIAKLRDEAAVEAERAAWKAGLEKLAAFSSNG
jgi:hypothetical protein